MDEARPGGEPEAEPVRDPDPASPWPPGPHAVRWSASDGDGDTRPVTLLVQHLTDPFVVTLGDEPDALQRAAFGYLVALLQLDGVGGRLKEALPSDWIESLRPNRGRPSASFGWLAVAWPVGDRAATLQQPFRSFRVGPAEADHVVASFASELIGEGQPRGSGFGLRVVFRLRRLAEGRWQAAATALAACLPFGVYRTDAVSDDYLRIEGRTNDLFLRLRSGRARIGRVASVDIESTVVCGVRLALPAGGLQIEFHGTGLAGSNDRTKQGDKQRVPHAFRVLRTPHEAVVLLHRSALVADGAPGSGCVFRHDPATQDGDRPVRRRRPNRDDPTLDRYRVSEVLTGEASGQLEAPRVRVLPCGPFVPGDRGRPPNDARTIELPGSGPEVRSADGSAGQAFHHVRDLLERLTAYGLPPADYFQAAADRIDVRYRTGIVPGPGKDGQTVNARVLPRGWPVDFIGPTRLDDRPVVELHLALATLARRARTPRGAPGEPARATYLGIGADARWMWHEFGHVLLMATTGELELRFAHSPGDGLAAIVADPESQLEREGPRWRFATFPWVFLPRRHDRSVLQGWGWAGAMHTPLAAVPEAMHPRRKGYRSEQILSSTLFRLYRCLGGDTLQGGRADDPDRDERRRASHYTTWLVMHALQLLGDARVLPAQGPEDLALALMLADTLRSPPWSATLKPGTPEERTYRRIGGCAHKAIRWAFEAQGLYTPPGGDASAPGAPPPVDVYIASRRDVVDATPYGVVDYGPGNYQPVSLHCQAAASDPIPAWQAADEAIVVAGDGGITVRVGNRGTEAATGVVVSVWWAEWPADTAPPDWHAGSGWTACVPPSESAGQTVVPDTAAAVAFGPFRHAPPATGRYVVLAVATCADDRANTDAATGLACSRLATPVVDLVANDNNLALRVVRPG